MSELIKKIVNMKFKKSLFGYNKLDTDLFLDSIIEELENKEKEYEDIIKDKEKIEQENFKLKVQVLVFFH